MGSMAYPVKIYCYRRYKIYYFDLPIDRLHKVRVLVTKREDLTHKLRISLPPAEEMPRAYRGWTQASGSPASLALERFFRPLNVRKDRIFPVINKEDQDGGEHRT